MSLIDDITKFCEDLVLGDFEEEPSNAAMIVGGVISLIPVAQQVLNVRDMSGMIYRISRKGAPNCSKDDWVDLAMAAFGCIPELGSLFKTIVKPLWKERKLLKGALRGEAFVSGMLGKAKGKAITFVKTLDWAGNTQVAIQQMDNALTGCDQLLGELEQSHWWLPDSVQGLAHDLRPSLQTIRGRFIRVSSKVFRRCRNSSLTSSAKMVTALLRWRLPQRRPLPAAEARGHMVATNRVVQASQPNRVTHPPGSKHLPAERHRPPRSSRPNTKISRTPSVNRSSQVAGLRQPLVALHGRRGKQLVHGIRG